MSYDNTSTGCPQLLILSIISFLVSIPQIVEDFGIRGAGNAYH